MPKNMQNKWQQLLADRSERVQQKTRKKRYGKYILRWMITLLILVMLVFGSICGLRLRHFYRAIHGEIPAESPDLSKFPVKGIDISRYQGILTGTCFPRKTMCSLPLSRRQRAAPIRTTYSPRTGRQPKRQAYLSGRIIFPV